MVRVALLTILLAACVDPGPQQDYIRISKIDVDETEGNGSQSLEIEVHLYDLESEAMIGCAELGGVDEKNVEYGVNALFEMADPDHGDYVRLEDIADREVYLWVVERDDGRCPEAVSIEDDIVGRSLPFLGAALADPQSLAFEYVNRLDIGPRQRRAHAAPPWAPKASAPEELRITEISVNESDFIGNLEVEVHLYEVGGLRLGCTGQRHGLEGVNKSGATYFVQSGFVNTIGQRLKRSDYADRTVELRVIERDTDAADCPSEPATGDDLIGVSEPFPMTDLWIPARTLSFDDVSHMVIGTAPTRLE